MQGFAEFHKLRRGLLQYYPGAKKIESNNLSNCFIDQNINILRFTKNTNVVLLVTIFNFATSPAQKIKKYTLYSNTKRVTSIISFPNSKKHKKR